MNITSDVNKNFDLLSNLKNEGQEASLLNTLFSINFENDISSELNAEKEFVFKEEEVAIINYLSNLIPNFQNENKNLSDLKKIKKQIEIDPNINFELKENILSFLKEEKFHFRGFNINILKKSNINNKKIIDSIDDPKRSVKQTQPSTNFVKIESTLNNVSKDYTINKEHISIPKTFENVNDVKQSNEQNYNGKNENIKFVKKIEKNNHPNKIYQLPQSNTLKYKQSNDITLQVEKKLFDNNNLNLINNQITEYPKNNKLNEIKMNNNQISNVQQSIQSNNSGSNLSQQNDSSFTNSSYNSVLENFIDNLDLTQKGWTSKLASRIENAFLNGGEEIEFNLKPKNLGVLKVSVKLKNGIGNVKIITENNFVTSALNQNENYLQKLFNEQGINLDFTAQNDSQHFGSRNYFNKNSNNQNQKKSQESDSEINKTSEEQIDTTTENNSSRHMINVIA